MPDEDVEHAVAELGRMGTGGTWDVHGRAVKVTNVDKVLFPGGAGVEPVTRRDLVAYAARVAAVSLPSSRVGRSTWVEQVSWTVARVVHEFRVLRGAAQELPAPS